MAHLDGDEKRAGEAQALRELVGRARETMKEECPAEPDLQVAKRRLRIDRAATWGARIVAMAACLVIGFGIARLRPAKQVEVVIHEKPANPPLVAVNDAKPAAEGELWSAQRIFRNAMEVNRSEKPKVGTKRIFQ